MELWGQAGFEPESFWRQTPRTLDAALSGYRARRRADLETATYHARLAAALDRWPKNKFLPALKELLAPPKPRDAKQSTDDMLAAFQDMRAAGAPITIKKVR